MVLTQRGLRAHTNRGDLRRVGITLHTDSRLALKAARLMRAKGEQEAASQFLRLAAHLEREAVAAFGGAA